MFYLLIQVVTVCIHTFVKVHQEIALRLVHIIVQIISGKSFVFKGKKNSLDSDSLYLKGLVKLACEMPRFGAFSSLEEGMGTVLFIICLVSLIVIVIFKIPVSS